MSAEPPILDYGNDSRAGGAASAWVALLLCAPGAACFIMYFADIGNFGLFSGMLVAAILTALASLVIYGRHPRRALRWYVLLNLAINISLLLCAGLSLTAVL